MRQEIFRMERVTYIARGITQLEDFNLQIYKGEIMGLTPIDAHGMGELLQLFQTNLPLYDGYIYYCGEKINSWKRSRKTPNRIGIIEAKSRLVERMTVSDNIFVLRQGFRQEILQDGLLRRQLAPFLQDIGMEIPAEAYVEKLSAFERVIVELLRAVIMEYRLIVLNEISTVLNGEELAKLHEIIRHYAAQGFSFIYVSLHLEEIMEICDRVALLSNGRIQKVIQKTEMRSETVQGYTKEFDRMIRYHLEYHNPDKEKRKPILTFSGITVGVLHDLHLNIYEGECLVIQNLDNQVFQDIVRLLTGEKRSEAGVSLMEGKEVSIKGNKNFAVISAEPTRSMIFPEMSYMDNLCMGLSQRISTIWLNHHIRDSIRREYGAVLGEEVFLKQMDELNEKEKYRLVYTRILLQKPKVVFCIQPFKGADLSHRMYIWKMMEMLLDRGMSVVILTINLADSMSLADRLVRLGKDGIEEIVEREAFGTLEFDAPWLNLYREE